jgi:3-oxoadipate enol-lactonase
MASVLETTMCRWFSARFRADGGDAPARRRLLNNDMESWKDAWHAIAGLHTAPRLSSIKVPTLCLAAEEDISAPPPVVGTIAKAIHNSQFVVIPDTPHMLFIEDPKAVAAALIPFLKSLPCDKRLEARAG